MRAGLARIMVNAAVGLMGVALGLGGSVAGAINVATGARRHRVRQLRWARTYAMIVGFGAVLAVVAMERALITRDFHLAYVAQVGSSRTPALFNFAAMWSALEGSILLWALILAGYLVAVVIRFRSRIEDPLVGWALFTMFIICVSGWSGSRKRSSARRASANQSLSPMRRRRGTFVPISSEGSRPVNQMASFVRRWRPASGPTSCCRRRRVGLSGSCGSCHCSPLSHARLVWDSRSRGGADVDRGSRRKRTVSSSLPRWWNGTLETCSRTS